MRGFGTPRGLIERLAPAPNQRCLWAARTGTPWRDSPERFGHWNSVFQRFNRCAKRRFSRDRRVDRQTPSTAYHRSYSLVEVRHTIARLERLVNEPEDILRRKLPEIVPESNPSSNGIGEQESPLGLEETRCESDRATWLSLARRAYWLRSVLSA